MTPNTVDLTTAALAVLAPEIILILSATLMTTLGAFVKARRSSWCVASFGALVLALIAFAVTRSAGASLATYEGVVSTDAFSQYSRLLLLLSAFVLFALAHDQVDDARAPEFFGSLLFVIGGSMIVGAANDMVLLFVGLELVSIPTYLLLYLPRRDSVALETATKYFFLSILSSGMFLFGLAYLYGVMGVSNLGAVASLSGRVAGVPSTGLGLLAVVFIMAGLGFRVAAVPFHFYAPDVYQGSPTFLAALLSWVPKAIGFVAILKALTPMVSAVGVSEALAQRSILLASTVALITMTLGNTAALSQNNLKRLFAYSSIAHAGYLMIGVAVSFSPSKGGPLFILAREGVLLYLTAYALMTLGAFGIIILLGSPSRPIETVEDFSGLAQSQPFWALMMTFCLFSLAGVPPFFGFLGKFGIFSAAVGAGGEDNRILWWLAVAGVINSAIGAYYYLRIVVSMYLQNPNGDPIVVATRWPSTVAVVFCAITSLVLGLYPAPILQKAHEAASLIALESRSPQIELSATPADIR